MDGFPLTPQQMLDVSVGSWAGRLDIVLTDATVSDLGEGASEVTWEGAPPELVSEEQVGWRYPNDSGRGRPEEFREPNEQACPNRVDIEMVATLISADAGLDETFRFVLETIASGYPRYETRFALDDLVGTATPPWGPEEWETSMLDLSVGFFGHDDIEPYSVMAGSATWLGQTTDGNSVDGDTAGLGGFNFQRPDDEQP